MTAALPLYFADVLLRSGAGVVHLVDIKHCFPCARECRLCFFLVSVTRRRSPSDAINSLAVGFQKEIVNHISDSGKQLRNGTPENCWVRSQWHNEKEKHGECARLTASHMFILMAGLPGAQVRRSRGLSKDVMLTHILTIVSRKGGGKRTGRRA